MVIDPKVDAVTTASSDELLIFNCSPCLILKSHVGKETVPLKAKGEKIVLLAVGDDCIDYSTQHKQTSRPNLHRHIEMRVLVVTFGWFVFKWWCLPYLAGPGNKPGLRISK